MTEKEEPTQQPTLPHLQILRRAASYQLIDDEFLGPGLISCCLLLLVLLIASSPAKRRHDESYHLAVAEDVRESGWQKALTSADHPSIPGPLYAALHLALSPLTRLQAPAVRWVNFLCLGALIFLLARQVDGSSLKARYIAAASILSVPYVWLVSGLALTEMPARVAFTLFVQAFLCALRLPDGSEGRAIGYAISAGLCLGLSILGRQSYLIALPVVSAMVFWLPRKWPVLLITVVLSLLVCGWLFVLWGGLVPPWAQRIYSRFRVDHVLLSFGYIAGATLFLQPQWMKPRNRRAWIGSLAVGVLLACVTRNYAVTPAKNTFAVMLGDRAVPVVGFLIGAGFAVVGVLWAWNTLQEAWREKERPTRAFLFLMLFALAVTPGAVPHLFSARYVVGAVGVLFLVIWRAGDQGPWWVVRMIIGSSLGAISLYYYYYC